MVSSPIRKTCPERHAHHTKARQFSDGDINLAILQ